MAIKASFLRKQLQVMKPVLASSSLETLRRGQNKIGELMSVSSKNSVIIKEHQFENFSSAWIIPRDERRGGVILYLHGGGYCAGDLEYTKGFGSILAVEIGAPVFTPAYRLAPENPFPAALDDAYEAYLYLLSKGFTPAKIVLAGESAGGGLCYSLLAKLK